MKPKHYPHVTLAAAILLLLLPASLLILIPTPQGQSSDEILAEVDRELQQIKSSVAPKAREVEPVPPRPSTRIAMLPDTARHQAGMFQSTPENLYSAAKSVSKPATPALASSEYKPSRDVAADSVTSEHSSWSVPKFSTEPVEPAAAELDTAELDTAELDTVISATPAATQPSAVVDFPATEPTVAEDRSEEERQRDERLSQELDATLAMGPATSDTYFQSTGHLAMTGRLLRNGTAKPAAVASKRTRQTGSSGRSKAKDETSPPVVSGAMPTADAEDPFSSEPNSPVVDVILQQPFEKRPVQKVENLIATTQEPGWPIALVRSDIPGDAWWVQQMVGIRNRSFASRVNFGNNDSLPGSVYHLVIVFLDSADEARRFRIAKQFKEIPEGLRRSREYTFVRK